MHKVSNSQFASIVVMTSVLTITPFLTIAALRTRASSAEVSRAELLRVIEPTFNFGKKRVGETLEAKYVLENTTSKPLRVLGCRVGCSCMVPQALPLTIEPHKHVSFTIAVKLPDEPEVISETFTVYTSLPTQRTVQLKLKGEVAY